MLLEFLISPDLSSDKRSRFLRICSNSETVLLSYKENQTFSVKL